MGALQNQLSEIMVRVPLLAKKDYDHIIINTVTWVIENML